MSDNPYEAPKYGWESDDASLPPGEIAYYRTDMRRLTYGELWRISPHWLWFFIAVLYKTLRFRLGAGFATADASLFRRVDSQQISAAAIRNLRPLDDQARKCGLRFDFTYVLPSLGPFEYFALAYHTTDGSTVVSCAFFRLWNRRTSTEQVHYSCFTRLSDDRVFITSGSRRQLNSPSHFVVEYLSGRPISNLIERHRARIAEYESAVVLVRDLNDVFATMRDIEGRAKEFHRARGVLVLATRLEMEGLARKSSQPAPLGPPRSTAYLGLQLLLLFAALVFLYLETRQPVAGPIQLPLLALAMIFVLVGMIPIPIYRALVNRRNRLAARDDSWDSPTN